MRSLYPARPRRRRRISAFCMVLLIDILTIRRAMREDVERKMFTSLACSLVRARGLVAASKVVAAAASGSVAVVQEASPAELSNRELVSRLGDLDRVAYTYFSVSNSVKPTARISCLVIVVSAIAWNSMAKGPRVRKKHQDKVNKRKACSPHQHTPSSARDSHPPLPRLLPPQSASFPLTTRSQSMGCSLTEPTASAALTIPS